VAANNRDFRVSAGGTSGDTNMDRVTNTLGQVRYRSDAAGTITYFRILLLGWTDFRR